MQGTLSFSSFIYLFIYLCSSLDTETVPIVLRKIQVPFLLSEGPNPRLDTVARQRLILPVANGSGQILTSPSDSVVCLMRIARAGFLSDTRHCPMEMSKVCLSWLIRWIRAVKNKQTYSSCKCSAAHPIIFVYAKLWY